MFDIQTLNSIPESLKKIKNPPQELFFIGNKELLNRKKVAIIGTRRPISYAKDMTLKISKRISESGGVVVSGAAMGVDALAHIGAGENTIAVMANSLDIIYPKINKELIKNIYSKSLALSEYGSSYEARQYSFVLRNRIVVGLSDAVVITQADIDSGSMRSAEFALEFQKPIFVLPHRYGESGGTNMLLKEKKATAIYDIDKFVDELGFEIKREPKDEVLEYLKSNPDYNDAVLKYPQKIFEYELEGKIVIENFKVRVL